jgi:uncharacterized protein with HEPN domain
MSPEDRIRIEHMLEAGTAAQQFISGRTRSDLDHDTMLLFALVRALEIIGEAAGRISLDTRAGAREIPWHLITATRNRLIHAYFDIDRDILWRTITDELPDLLARLRTLLSPT